MTRGTPEGCWSQEVAASLSALPLSRWLKRPPARGFAGWGLVLFSETVFQRALWRQCCEKSDLKAPRFRL